MTWGVHLYWLIGWIVGGFGVVEGLAVLHHNRADTFSGTVWVWLGTYSHPKNRALRLAVFAPFWLVLGLHFAVGLHAWPWLIFTSIPLTTLVLWSTFVLRES